MIKLNSVKHMGAPGKFLFFKDAVDLSTAKYVGLIGHQDFKPAAKVIKSDEVITISERADLPTGFLIDTLGDAPFFDMPDGEFIFNKNGEVIATGQGDNLATYLSKLNKTDFCGAPMRGISVPRATGLYLIGSVLDEVNEDMYLGIYCDDDELKHIGGFAFMAGLAIVLGLDKVDLGRVAKQGLGYAVAEAMYHMVITYPIIGNQMLEAERPTINEMRRFIECH